MPRRIPPRKKPVGAKQRRIRRMHPVSHADIAELLRLRRMAPAKRGGRTPIPAGVDPQMVDFVHQVVHDNIVGTRLHAELAAQQIVKRYGDHEHVGFVLRALPENMHGPVMFYIMEILKERKPD